MKELRDAYKDVVSLEYRVEQEEESSLRNENWYCKAQAERLANLRLAVERLAWVVRQEEERWMRRQSATK